MRVLLTRAIEDAARTREKLEAAGHSVVLSPVIEIVESAVAWPSGVVEALVATSAHAFAASISGLGDEARRLLPLLLVGARTEAAARAAGFLGPADVARTAAELIAALDARPDRPRRTVYLAGEDRKPDIETAWAERHIALEGCLAYRAEACERLTTQAALALTRETIDAILHFSRRSAELFVAACEKTGVGIGRPVHLCLSEDVATVLKTRGDVAVEIAASPTEAGLLALLDRL